MSENRSSRLGLAIMTQSGRLGFKYKDPNLIPNLFNPFMVGSSCVLVVGVPPIKLGMVILGFSAVLPFPSVSLCLCER
jgi:hypothetical protein